MKLLWLENENLHIYGSHCVDASDIKNIGIEEITDGSYIKIIMRDDNIKAVHILNGESKLSERDMKALQKILLTKLVYKLYDSKNEENMVCLNNIITDIYKEHSLFNFTNEKENKSDIL